MAETLSDIVKRRVQEEPRNSRIAEASAQLISAKILAAIGAMSLMAAFGIWVGECLRVSGH